MSASERHATLDRARQAGRDAYSAGKPATANPYKADHSRAAWWSGWDAAKAATMPRESPRARWLKESCSQAALYFGDPDGVWPKSKEKEAA